MTTRPKKCETFCLQSFFSYSRNQIFYPFPMFISSYREKNCGHTFLRYYKWLYFYKSWASYKFRNFTKRTPQQAVLSTFKIWKGNVLIKSFIQKDCKTSLSEHLPNKTIAVCTEDMINDLLLFTLKLVMSSKQSLVTF